MKTKLTGFAETKPEAWTSGNFPRHENAGLFCISDRRNNCTRPQNEPAFRGGRCFSRRGNRASGCCVLFGTDTALAADTTVAAAAHTTFSLFPVSVYFTYCQCNSCCNDNQQQNIRYAHSPYPSPKSRPANRTRNAATHAIKHCHRTTPKAQRPPSSRLMDAIAATQGV